MSDSELQPEDERRATVDVTIESDRMLAVKAELRRRLLEQYHLLKIAARASRKTGKKQSWRKQDEAAQHCLLMIWCVDNPMDSSLQPPERTS